MPHDPYERAREIDRRTVMVLKGILTPILALVVLAAVVAAVCGMWYYAGYYFRLGWEAAG